MRVFSRTIIFSILSLIFASLPINVYANNTYNPVGDVVNFYTDVGNGILESSEYLILRTADFWSDVIVRVVTTKNTYSQTANAGGVLSNFLDRLSDYFVPLFSKNIASPSFVTETPSDAPNSKTVNTPTYLPGTNTIVEKIIEKSSYPVYVPSGVDSLRAELVAMNTSTVEYMKGLIGRSEYRTSESVYKTADRSTKGTVTSVGMSTPTGLSVSGGPIETSGTLALTLTDGYVIPLTASTTEWAAKGNVFGPSSAADDAIVTFDGATGKVIAASSQVLYQGAYEYVSIDPGSNTLHIPTASGYLTLGGIYGQTYLTSTGIFGITGGSETTITGATVANGDLTLKGTSNATKASSYVILQPDGGNVGIGTTTPSAKLDIQGSGLSTNDALIVRDSNGEKKFTVADNGQIAIYQSTDVRPYIQMYRGYGNVSHVGGGMWDLQIDGGDAWGDRGWVRASASNGASIGQGATTLASFETGSGYYNGGNFGIGTTTPSSKLSLTQSANTSAGGLWIAETGNTDFRSVFMDTSGIMSFYGGDTGGTLNTATLNAAGEWTNASDRIYKDNITDLSYGLEDLMKLQPRSYTIKNSDLTRVGFIAQEMELVIPEVVAGEEGSKGISYGNLVAVVVKAVQELKQLFDSLAELVTTKQVVTEDFCIADADGSKTCITKSQLDLLLQNTGQTPEPLNDSPSESSGEHSDEQNVLAEPALDPIQETESQPEVISEPVTESVTESTPEPEPAPEEIQTLEPEPEPLLPSPEGEGNGGQAEVETPEPEPIPEQEAEPAPEI